MRLQFQFCLIAVLLGAFCLISVVSHEEQNSHEEPKVEEASAASSASASSSETEVFQVPKFEGEAAFLETFSDDSWKDRWHVLDEPPYTGKWTVESGEKGKGQPGDHGLIMSTPGARHGISAKFPKVVTNEGKTLVVQYELRAENKYSCDGGYIKLLSDGFGYDPKSFKDNTPYTIMFGPDKCGGTDKVHFILRHKNPKSGVFEEKHLKDAPRVPNDALTHVYTLIIDADNKFEILIDNVVKAEGSLFEAMNPPINPPAEIDDPSDKKPADWEDNEFIDDPEDKKPDDWDETLPEYIEDADAVKPSYWLDDEPETVADPEAKQPDDWDSEEDGDWEAPHVPNPKCDAGNCGVWKRPMIKNPAYRGKWAPKRIKNPKFIGIWKPKKIANPDYYNDEHPSHIHPIAGVGIELLSLSGGLVFDNLVVSHDEDAVAKFRENTWGKRNKVEQKEYKEEAKKTADEPDLMAGLLKVVEENPALFVIVIVTIILVLFLVIWRFCLTESAPAVEDEDAGKRKKEDTTKPDDKPEEKKEEKPAAAAASSSSSTPTTRARKSVKDK